MCEGIVGVWMAVEVENFVQHNDLGGGLYGRRVFRHCFFCVGDEPARKSTCDRI